MGEQLTPQQINAVYQRAGSIPMQQLLELCLNPNSGITIEKLRAANYKKIDELEQKFLGHAQDKIWEASQGSVDSLIGYVQKIKQGVYSDSYLATAEKRIYELSHDSIDKFIDYIQKIEQGLFSDTYLEQAKANLVKLAKGEIRNEWSTLSGSSDVNAINDFVDRWISIENFINRRGGTFDSEELKEARNKIEAIANGTIIEDFNRLKAIEDDYKRVPEINAFIQKYARNTTDTAKNYLNKASELLEWTKENITAREDWFKTKKQDDVQVSDQLSIQIAIQAYVEFISKHPSCRYREEADTRIAELKGDLLTDIKRFPFNYHREEMFKYISTKTLTYEDLVSKSYILTDKAYNHILRYPQLKDEQRILPMSTLANPHSQEGNTDIYFFGVPGSGKTCVLAGLLSLSGQLGFDFDPRGEGGGGPYAVELQNYARSSMLPPKTDDYYIQVIDCQIDDENKNTHNISFIEMAGEKTRDFAFMENPTSLDALGQGAAGLLQNNNNKVIFFVIDPTNEQYVVMDDGTVQLYKQDNVLNCVAALLSKNKDLMKKVTAIHIILTKSDTLGEYADANVIKDRLTQQGYQAVLNRIRKICETYDINKATGFQVGLFPFRVGKFMPGDVYTFDETDALKILRVIQANTTSIRQQGWKGKFFEWFNS